MQTEDTEEWREVPGSEGLYEVSSIGGVRRLKPARGKKAGQLQPTTTSDGYSSVCLSVNKKTSTKVVHQIVAAAFIGPCPEGQEVNHKNGVKHDNSAENLEYLTHQENVIHGLNLPERKARMAARAQVRADSKIKYVTYNYSLPIGLSARLADFCERTERSASDVVRQLMLEYMEGDRVPVLTETGTDPTVRSSLRLRAFTLKAFERDVDAKGHPSKAIVLEALLRAFLDRSPKIVEQVSATVMLSVEISREASLRAAHRGVTLCDFLSEMISMGLGSVPVQKED